MVFAIGLLLMIGYGFSMAAKATKKKVDATEGWVKEQVTAVTKPADGQGQKAPGFDLKKLNFDKLFVFDQKPATLDATASTPQPSPFPSPDDLSRSRYERKKYAKRGKRNTDEAYPEYRDSLETTRP